MLWKMPALFGYLRKLLSKLTIERKKMRELWREEKKKDVWLEITGISSRDVSKKRNSLFYIRL